MKELEKLFKWLIPLALIGAIGNTTWLSLFSLFTSGAPQGLFGMSPKETISFMTSVVPIFDLIIKVAIAAWLFVVAQKAKATRWLWAAFGILFGLWAVALFYLVRLYDTIEERREPVESEAVNLTKDPSGR